LISYFTFIILYQKDSNEWEFGKDIDGMVMGCPEKTLQRLIETTKYFNWVRHSN
jgi:hypothetical protein